MARARRRYLEKSPPNAAKFPFLQAMFKDAARTVFVALVRHPVGILRGRFHGFEGKPKEYNNPAELANSLRTRLECWWV